MQQNSVNYHVINGYNYPKSKRSNDWVADYQIKMEFPEFLKKVDEVSRSHNYSTKSKEICKSIANVLKSDGLITWKQFDCVMSATEIPKSAATYKRIERSSRIDPDFMPSIFNDATSRFLTSKAEKFHYFAHNGVMDDIFYFNSNLADGSY